MPAGRGVENIAGAPHRPSQPNFIRFAGEDSPRPRRANLILLFAFFLALSLAGIPLGRSGREADIFVLALVALFFAAAILLFQPAALALLRLLPWRGPRLKMESDEDDLRRVFE
ncbi:MAG TPA: hypothetical protein VF535_15195 [Allosphingosinicella sp.]